MALFPLQILWYNIMHEITGFWSLNGFPHVAWKDNELIVKLNCMLNKTWRYQWPRSCVLIVNFEQISYIDLMFPLLILNK